MQQRKLGYWESVLCFMHDRLMSTGTIVTMSQIMGRLDRDRFEKAITWLIQRHPLLRAVLVAHFGARRFQQIWPFFFPTLRVVSGR